MSREYEPMTVEQQQYLEARNARLQERVEEAEGHWKRCEEGWNKTIKQAEGFLALAERRKKALDGMLLYLDTVEEWDEEGEVWAGIKAPDRLVSVKRVDVVAAIKEKP